MRILYLVPLLLASFLQGTNETKTQGKYSAILQLLRRLEVESNQGHAAADHLSRRSGDQDDDGMWLPSSGISRDQWLECRGMDCEVWARTKENMLEIYKEANHMAEMPTDQGSVDVMNVHHPNFDGSLDGCIWLTEEQTREVLQHMSRRKKRKLIDFTMSSFNMWPAKEPIKWKFDNEHTGAEKQIIRSAFQSWMDETCVRFEEVGTNEIVYDNHILITRKLTGCHSYVGRVGLVPQQLNLQDTCLKYFGIPIHEIGHALGLWHEQQRADRDSTIVIRTENLGYYTAQFSKLNTNNLSVPYDVSSVMHYAPKDGSNNGRNVMETIDPLYQSTMGQKTGMSFNDALIINKAYCSKTCSYQPLSQPCQSGGYQDPNDCSKCKCPPGFSGSFCQDLALSKGAPCGGVVEVSKTEQLIESPGYTTPGYYDNHIECNWKIRAPPGDRVVLRFVDEFAVYWHSQQQCFHWLEIRYNNHLGSLGPRFCGYKTPTAVLTSDTNEMLLVMRSNWTTPYTRARKGFRVMVRAERGDSNINSGSDMDTKTTTTTTTTTTTVTTTETTTKTPTTTTTTKEPSTTTTNRQMNSNDWMWDCNFDTYDGQPTWCDMRQDYSDNFDWTLIQGGTPSELTGPTSAFDRNYYVYIEASNPRRKGDEATLWTPKLAREGSHCVTFYYHMFGFHINLLEVKQGSLGSNKVKWFREGQQGFYWKKGEVSVILDFNDRIGFTATRGGEYSGDIALDHIHIRPGHCSSKWGNRRSLETRTRP